MEKFIIDCECNGLLNTADKIYSLGWCNTKDGIIHSTNDIEKMKIFLIREDIMIVGHNFILFDKVVLEKVLNITIKAKIVDTLSLSWILSPERQKHGLESYGIDYHEIKFEVKDWENLSLEDSIKRVEQDVKINWLLWKNQAKILTELYEGNHQEIYRYLDYLSFKLDCIKNQQKTGIKLDIPLINSEIVRLEALKEEKIIRLKEGMPKVEIKSIRSYPKVFRKADGSLSANGQKWLLLLQEKGLPDNYTEDIEVIVGYEEPNPNSHDQIKKALYNLGWSPLHIKHVRDKKKNEVRKVPQIKSKDEEGEICESIKKLFPQAPYLEALDDLFVISHRISVFKGFLENQKDGYLYQEIHGITNTLRFMHKNIVNLPSVFKPYGENIRASLITRDNNHILVNADLSGVEDNTKRHYIYIYDKKYVEDMNTPGYDAHLELAILSGLLTQEQADEHKLYDKTKGAEGKSWKEVRHKAKTSNFALTYKTGITTLARTAGITESQAKKLKDVYWKRNKAILDVENSLKIKQIHGQQWLLNPVSKFWYTLRTEKDKFSTLNQGTAVFVYDTWLKYVRKTGLDISFQVHDELNSDIWKIDKEEVEQNIKKAIELTNEELKLNIKIGCSVQFGQRYSEAH